MTAIEACSCPMFCQCYFNTKPAGPRAGTRATAAAQALLPGQHRLKVNKGHYGATKLDGAKFWVATDLGDDFGEGEMDWAVLYFDKTADARPSARRSA